MGFCCYDQGPMWKPWPLLLDEFCCWLLVFCLVVPMWKPGPLERGGGGGLSALPLGGGGGLPIDGPRRFVDVDERLSYFGLTGCVVAGAAGASSSSNGSSKYPGSSSGSGSISSLSIFSGSRAVVSLSALSMLSFTTSVGGGGVSSTFDLPFFRNHQAAPPISASRSNRARMMSSHFRPPPLLGGC